VRVIAADGSVLQQSLEGAGASNALCAGFRPQGPEITSRAGDAEDSRSVSLFIAYAPKPRARRLSCMPYDHVRRS
jgi:hypothetical protein